MIFIILGALLISICSFDMSYKTNLKLRRIQEKQELLEYYYKELESYKISIDDSIEDTQIKLEKRLKIMRKMEKIITKLEKKVYNKTTDFNLSEN